MQFVLILFYFSFHLIRLFTSGTNVPTCNIAWDILSHSAIGPARPPTNYKAYRFSIYIPEHYFHVDKVYLRLIGYMNYLEPILYVRISTRLPSYKISFSINIQNKSKSTNQYKLI